MIGWQYFGPIIREPEFGIGGFKIFFSAAGSYLFGKAISIWDFISNYCKLFLLKKSLFSTKISSVFMEKYAFGIRILKAVRLISWFDLLSFQFKLHTRYLQTMARKVGIIIYLFYTLKNVGSKKHMGFSNPIKSREVQCICILATHRYTKKKLFY